MKILMASLSWKVCAITVLALARCAVFARDAPALAFEFDPHQIVAPSGNLGGTEIVRIRLRNKSAAGLEFSSTQWFVVERVSVPGIAVFAPPPPFIPLDLKSNETVEILWRLRQPPEYFDNAPGLILPGRYVARVYVRSKGAPAFQAINYEFVIGESAIAHGMGWLLIAFLALVAIGAISAGVARCLKRGKA